MARLKSGKVMPRDMALDISKRSNASYHTILPTPRRTIPVNDSRGQFVTMTALMVEGVSTNIDNRSKNNPPRKKRTSKMTEGDTWVRAFFA